MIRKRHSILNSNNKKTKIIRTPRDAASITLTNILSLRELDDDLIKALVMEANTFPAFATMNIQLYAQVLFFMLQSGTSSLVTFDYIKKYIEVLLPKSNDNQLNLTSTEDMLVLQRYYVEFLSYLKYINNQRTNYNNLRLFITQHMQEEQVTDI